MVVPLPPPLVPECSHVEALGLLGVCQTSLLAFTDFVESSDRRPVLALVRQVSNLQRLQHDLMLAIFNSAKVQLDLSFAQLVLVGGRLLLGIVGGRVRLVEELALHVGVAGEVRAAGLVHLGESVLVSRQRILV